MAGGNTFPRNTTILGTVLFRPNRTKGTSRVAKVQRAAMAIVAMDIPVFMTLPPLFYEIRVLPFYSVPGSGRPSVR